MQTHLIHIFIVTGDKPAKCVPALERIWPDLSHGVCVSLLSAAEATSDDDSVKQHFPSLLLHHHPGESVWHLRQRIGALTQHSRWMLLLEDHNLPLPGWLPALVAELQRTDDGIHALFGTTDNLTSLGPWDWANYLAVQVFHWAPGIADVAHPLPFNAALRVAQMPHPPWALGSYEALAVGKLARHGRSSANFQVDHIQPRSFPSVLTYHFANGQATGAHIRVHQPHPLRRMIGHTVHALLVRPLQSAQVIGQHPKRHVLPSGTWWRVPMLLLFHAAGALYGYVAGPGKSMWQLE